MKWNYKNCDVEITVTYAPNRNLFLTPVVEIDGGSPGLQALITTSNTFEDVEAAEQYGKEMARQWIDENNVGGSDGNSR